MATSNTIHAVACFEAKSNLAGISGTVRFTQRPNERTRVDIDLSGVPVQKGKAHGIHIHEYGDLTHGCESACAHFNPYDADHGNGSGQANNQNDAIEPTARKFVEAKKNRHVGDLINNITADDYGRVRQWYYDDLVQLSSEDSVVGRMVVIHEDEDDLGEGSQDDSKTTGHAGKRIACAVIGRAAPALAVSCDKKLSLPADRLASPGATDYKAREVKSPYIEFKSLRTQPSQLVSASIQFNFFPFAQEEYGNPVPEQWGQIVQQQKLNANTIYQPSQQQPFLLQAILLVLTNAAQQTNQPFLLEKLEAWTPILVKTFEGGQPNGRVGSMQLTDGFRSLRLWDISFASPDVEAELVVNLAKTDDEFKKALESNYVLFFIV